LLYITQSQFIHETANHTQLATLAFWNSGCKNPCKSSVKILATDKTICLFYWRFDGPFLDFVWGETL